MTYCIQQAVSPVARLTDWASLLSVQMNSLYERSKNTDNVRQGFRQAHDDVVFKSKRSPEDTVVAPLGEEVKGGGGSEV